MRRLWAGFQTPAFARTKARQQQQQQEERIIRDQRRQVSGKVALGAFSVKFWRSAQMRRWI